MAYYPAVLEAIRSHHGYTVVMIIKGWIWSATILR